MKYVKRNRIRAIAAICAIAILLSATGLTAFAENTEEHYLKAKEKLGLKEDSLTEYKIVLFKSQLNAKEEEYLKVLSENKRLKKECKAEREFNEKIKNSKSWKLMNTYRKIRR